MNAKYLIFGSLAAMAILVGILLFAFNGNGEANPALEPAPAAMDTPVAEPWTPADTPASNPDTAAAPGAADGGGSPAAGAPRPGSAEGSPGGAPGSAPAAPDGDVGRAAPGAGSGTGEGASGGAEPTAPTPRTDEILRATARAYRDVQAMQADFEQRLRNTLLGTTVRSSGTLYQRQPDRFLMRFSEPAGDVIVSDGRYFWLYFPSTDPDQVLRSRRGAGGLDLQSQFIGDPVARFDATYDGSETDRGRATDVLTLVPREPLGYERLKVWIDARDHLIRRFELTEGNGVVRLFVLSDLRLNPSLPDRLFEFTPPAGARVVDQG